MHSQRPRTPIPQHSAQRATPRATILPNDASEYATRPSPLLPPCAPPPPCPPEGDRTGPPDADEHSPIALPPTHGAPVQLNPRRPTALPHRYSLAFLPLASPPLDRRVKSTLRIDMSEQGASALHWSDVTTGERDVPVRLSMLMSRTWKRELVQLPSPGAPLNRVHCEMVKAPPRRCVAWMFVREMLEATVCNFKESISEDLEQTRARVKGHSGNGRE